MLFQNSWSKVLIKDEGCDWLIKPTFLPSHYYGDRIQFTFDIAIPVVESRKYDIRSANT
jgi:hypothetical protein